MARSVTHKLLPGVLMTVEKLINEFHKIPNDRKIPTQQLTTLIEGNSKSGGEMALIFICTHNSRRSHIAQVWAQTAAYFYNITNVRTFSGGTEATAFNRRAATAMKKAGFEFAVAQAGENPVYEVTYAHDAPPLTVFSKKYDDPFNPKKNFAAVMTCSHADQNCPLVTGASARIALTYGDPKDFDGTPLEAAKYSERVEEIGREILYAFSKLK